MEDTFFDLTDEQRALYRSLFDFSRKHLAPLAPELDRRGEWSWDGWEKLAEMGLLGLPLPEEYGGSGASALTTAIAFEAVAAGGADAGLLLSWGVQLTICAVPIWKLGAEAQRRKYLPKLATGEWVGAFALTEPNSGSDAGAGGLRTRAERRGDVYVLNGSKMFITNGPIARVVLVFAVTDPDKGAKGRDGVSAFLVETDTPGFSAGKPLDKLGHRSSPTSELTFNDCVAPAENLLGREGEGLSVVGRLCLEWERSVLLAPSLGGIAHSLSESLRYARERRQFGHPIADYQAIRHKLADMAVGLEAARLLIRRAAWLKDRDQPASVEAAEAKLFTAEARMRAALEAIQIHGGCGYVKEFAVERGPRDAKLAEIGAGTSEMQRLIIAHGALQNAPLQGYPLSEEQLAYWRKVRDFAQTTIAPRAAEVEACGSDTVGRPLRENLRALADFGCLGLGFPEEYGGSGRDLITATLAVEELSRACASTALVVNASTLCAATLLLFGSNAQKMKFLPRLLRGEWVGAVSLGKPGADSEAVIRAVRGDDEWTLNGSQSFVVNGPVADVFLIPVAAGPNQDRAGFLIERGTPGLSTGKPLGTLGCRGAPVSEIVFRDCRAPDENVLGDTAEAETILRGAEIFERARIGFGAWCLGVAQACLDEAVKYANRHRLPTEAQAARFKLADMRTAVEAARLVVLRAAWLKDRGRPCALESAAAKLLASQAATQCAHHALQIHGPDGYLRQFPIERLYRDARLAEIAGGTTEAMKDGVAEVVLREA